jgi:acylphosphatase
MASVSRVRLRIVGRVQGVGFRDFVRREANRLGLAGWVRNIADGSVEVEAEGPRARLAALVDAARRGPASSRVGAVEETWAEAEPAHAAFRVLPDG